MWTLKRIVFLNLAAAAWAAGLFSATAANPVDPHLRDVYQRIRFDRMYPPEAVEFIQQQINDKNPALEPLIGLAKDPRSEVRALVAVLLSEMGGDKAVVALWQLTLDESRYVQVTAVGSLLRLAQKGKIQPQLAGLEDGRPEVRRMTAAICGALREKIAEEPLVKLLKDEDELVRMEAVRALGSLDSESAGRHVLGAFKDPSIPVRTTAVMSLRKVTKNEEAEEAIDAFVEALRDEDWHVRAAAVSGLAGYVNDADRRELVVRKLKEDEFALVRDRAADVLSAAKSEESVEALVAAIIAEDKNARLHAARGIIFRKLVPALPKLSEHRNHEDPDVRLRIMEIFGEIGGEDQFPFLVEGTADPSPMVRLAAVHGLKNLSAKGSVDAIKLKLTDSNPHVRAASARAMGEIGEQSVAPALIKMLRDEFGFVRAAAAEALGKLGSRDAIAPLIEMLIGMRGSAGDTSGESPIIGTQDSGLTEVLQLKRVEQQVFSVKALGYLRAEEAVDPIIKHGLKNEDAIVRAESAVALGMIKSPRAVDPLQEAVKPYYDNVPVTPKDDTTPTIDTGKIDDAFRQAQEKESRVRASVIWALGQICDPRSVAVIQRATRDENSLVRDAAFEALSRVADCGERLAAGNLALPIKN
jgi:HEAT repeat protein